ncbi:hypothetical protein [Candidatus Colwellia aromaticivorans]|uniref:hypothetical protein n=1 Tax=Candidatus Colwellia aromaticivorans TaxID=2267621 RepID=UPI000DF35922|nr:hypothetical protein [Candidatus Colwellia aromaticivorans]
MIWNEWFKKWQLESLKITTPFAEAVWQPMEADSDAAWELYIELLTRITTQRLAPEDGDEKTALDSIYSLFSLTRSIIKHYGRDCFEFTKLAIIVLNQVIRPFTAKWHSIAKEGGFEDEDTCRQFREDLARLQIFLHGYTQALADMAGVEDLTNMEDQ